MLDTTTPRPNYTLDQWKQILVNAHAKSQTDPINPRWQQAMADARTAIKESLQHQDRVNQIMSNAEMQEAQDPGAVGTGAATALKSIGQGALDFVQQGPFGQGLANNVLDKLNLPHQPELTTEELMSPETRKALATGEERHPVAAAIGETAPIAVPALASVGGWYGRGAALARETKGLNRDILRETLESMRSKAPTQAEQAGLRTDILRGQAARVPVQAEQAGLRTDILQGQVDRIPGQADALGLRNQAALKRIELMEQQLARGEPTMENLQLRNELMRLKLEVQTGGDAAALDLGEILPPTPPTPPPTGGAPAVLPPKPPVAPAGAAPNPLEGFMGTGPESMTAQDLASTKVIGRPDPLDALKTLPDEALGTTPPVAQSAMAPGVQENQVSQLARSLLNKEPSNPTATAPTRAQVDAQVRAALKKAGLPSTQADVLRLKQMGKESGGVVPGNPLAPEQFPLTQELIENQQGLMGQKAVQIGENSPLNANPANKAEILNLFGQLAQILGKKGKM